MRIRALLAFTLILVLLSACNLPQEVVVGNSDSSQQEGQPQAPLQDGNNQPNSPSDGADELADSPIEECIAQPVEYHWEYTEITKEQGSRGWKCKGSFTVKNTGALDLVLYPWLTTSTGKGHHTYTGFGPGGRILAHGESFTDTINFTAYDNGDVTYKEYRYILVRYYSNDCSWIDPTIPQLRELNSQMAQAAVQTNNPCTNFSEMDANMSGAFQQELTALTAGTFASTLYDMTVSTICSPGEMPAYGNQSFEITDNAIWIADDQGTREYAYQFADRFCREREDGMLECISGVQEAPAGEAQLTYWNDDVVTVAADLAYTITVYENPDQEDICYRGIQVLEVVD